MSDFKPLLGAQSHHSMGELCKTCGVTRKMVLNYEDHGLIQAISVNKDSGYRYYGAPSVARICHIRSLQRVCFSLDDIYSFFQGDDAVLEQHLDNLEKLRVEIDNQISRTKALLTEPGDLSIHREFLPACDCIVQTQRSETRQDVFDQLWKLTDYVFQRGWQVAIKSRALISIRYLDPTDENYGLTTAAWSLHEPNEETVHFEGSEALCVNVKGPYSQVPAAIQQLLHYAAENKISHQGRVHIAYLTSPQSHSRPEQYVTQVFLLIHSEEKP